MSMFGALNRFIARLDADPQGEKVGLKGASGFQVVRNTNEELPLEPWFDFIVGINGRQIDNPEGHLFSTEVHNCAGTSISLNIWSAKGQRHRSIYVPVPNEKPSLGVSLQWCSLSITDEVWHILDVTPNSPADKAGLLPYGDYIIGTSAGLVKGESGFGELVEHHLNQPLELHVYNQEYNVTRPVTIEPSRSWGGQGALGCVLGYGALHRIPAPLDEPPQAPGETLFETARLSSDVSRPYSDGTPPQSSTPPQYIVPADAHNLAAPPRTSSKTSKTKKTKPAASMDAYFAEGEAKSKELDHAPSPKPSEGLVPPPKAGGPPRSGSTSEKEADAEDEKKS